MSEGGREGRREGAGSEGAREYARSIANNKIAILRMTSSVESL